MTIVHAPDEHGQLSLELTAEEVSTLQRCERVIEEGRKTFLSVGNALMTIREKRLYRQTHTSFDAYLKERWDMGRSTAYRMMEAVEVVNDLSPIGDTLPTNEAQTRPLATLEPEARREAWQEVVEEAEAAQEPITAAKVQAVVDRRKPEAPPTPKPEPAPVAPALEIETPTADQLATEGALAIARAEHAMAIEAAAVDAPTPVAPVTPTPPVAAKPAITPPSPAPVTGAMVSCLLPATEYDWLLDQGLTPGTAIARLRELTETPPAPSGFVLPADLQKRLEDVCWELSAQGPAISVLQFIERRVEIAEQHLSKMATTEGE